MEALRAERAAGRNPMEIKAIFAHEMVARFHSEEAAVRAATTFREVYSKDAVPDDVATVDVSTDGDSLWIAKALSATGLVASTGDGKRLAQQGGIEVDGERVTDPQLQLAKGSTYLLRAGSKNRRFIRVRVV